jgi:hypothetical protein
MQKVFLSVSLTHSNAAMEKIPYFNNISRMKLQGKPELELHENGKDVYLMLGQVKKSPC